MRIAVTCENNEVFQHFGHTPEFAVFTVDEDKVVSKRILSCGGIAGAAGNVDEAVSTFLKGELSVNPDFQCHHHDGDSGHKCGEHHCGNGHCN